MKGQHTPEFLIKHNALIQERTRQREEKNKARLVRRVVLGLDGVILIKVPHWVMY